LNRIVIITIIEGMLNILVTFCVEIIPKKKLWKGRYKGREDKEEDASSFWMDSSK
jgi:hypothetical protein